MSFDELPPDAEPSQVEDAASPAQEPSVTDAPPAAPTHSSDAEDAGTAAASITKNAELTNEDEVIRQETNPSDADLSQKPTRSRTSRRRVTHAAETEAPKTETAEVEEAPPPAARTSRRRRATGPAPVEAHAASETAQEPKAEAAPASGVEPPPTEDAGAARRTRSSRKAVAPPAAVSEPEATPEPAVEPAARSSRRRTVRKASEDRPPAPPTISEADAGAASNAADSGDEGVAKGRGQGGAKRKRKGAASDAPIEQAAPIEPDAPIAPPPPEAAAPAAEAAPTTRRRSSRSRRKAEPAEAAVENATAPLDLTAEGVGETPLDAVAETAAETAEEEPDAASLTQTGPERRRRNRRGGRGRRGESISRPETPTETAPAAPAVSGRTSPTPSPSKEAPPARVVIIEEPPIDLTVGAHLVRRNGGMTIQIDGKPYAPALFFGNMEGGKNTQRVLSEARRAARAGVHLHSTLIELPCPLSEASHALDEIDVRLRTLLDADPEGFVMPRVVFLPARGWKREYPTEISTYGANVTGDPSLTSARFWQECERSLETLIHHIRDQVWGHRVFAYHLERGEWFQPADLGFDRSMANRDAFRDWLREKYEHNLVALRAAWYDGDVQFHTAEIPPVPTKPNPQRAFFETRRERSQIDFNEFTSESTARRLIALAKVVKRAVNNNALVSLCYGYTLEFGHGFSGHLALDLLLAERSIDLICGPPSYRDRKPGGAASFPAPVDTLALHGKLWLSEDDTKTYLAPTQQEPDDFNPRLGDRNQTEQAHWRAIGKALIHGTALNWMDLWGEGWLDEDATWERISAFLALLRTQDGSRPTPDVVALIDEKSLLHIQKGEPFFRRLTNGLRDTLQRAGVSYGFYLQNDLSAPNFPTDARLYLFLTPYRLTAAQREAIKEKLQGRQRTLVWLYAPGACEERPSLPTVMEEAATGTIGITLRQQPWNSEVGSRLTETGHPVTERMPGRELGARERLNPTFYVDDPAATVLAEYHGSNLPSLAVKDLGSWKSVFVGEPGLPLELLRGIARYAGVPLWTDGGDDVVDAGAGWVMIHAARDGQRVLKMPSRRAVYDLIEQRLVAADAVDYRFFLRGGATRLFFTGKIEQMERLGLQNLDLPSRTSRPLTPPPVPAAEAEVVLEPILAESNPDLETLRAVLSMEMPENLEIEEEEDEIDLRVASLTRPNPPLSLEEALGGSVTGNGRRRRRRGGRGRGRRKPEAADAAPEGEAAPVSEEIPVITQEGVHQVDYELTEPLGHVDDFHDPAPMGVLPEPEEPLGDWSE